MKASIQCHVSKPVLIATRFNGQNLQIPKVKTESVKREFYYSGVDIYNALPTHLETEKFHLLCKQGLEERCTGKRK